MAIWIFDFETPKPIIAQGQWFQDHDAPAFNLGGIRIRVNHKDKRIPGRVSMCLRIGRCRGAHILDHDLSLSPSQKGKEGILIRRNRTDLEPQPIAIVR